MGRNRLRDGTAHHYGGRLAEDRASFRAEVASSGASLLVRRDCSSVSAART